jgi:hypothetical protein
MNRAYRGALICGIAPLIVGISIFLLWVITRWEGLKMAGYITLWGGLFFFVLGIIDLARFCRFALRTPELPRWRLWLSTLGCSALLLSNFVVAGGIIMGVDAIETRYTVIVHNTSQQPLHAVRVFGGGCEADSGTIPAGGVARRSFWIQHNGVLEFRAASGSTTYAQIIDRSVYPGTGGNTTVTINPDGTISVSGTGFDYMQD